MCPPINHGPSSWWCGDSGNAVPCQNVTVGVGRLVNYTGGVVLGFPAYTSSAAGQTAGATSFPGPSDASSLSTIRLPTSSAAVASPSPQTSHEERLIALAIGVGIGVPLGVAALGFLSFLFWRETKSKDEKGKARDLRSANIHRHRTFQSLDSGRRIGELPSSQMACELDHRAAKVEMANSPT